MEIACPQMQSKTRTKVSAVCKIWYLGLISFNKGKISGRSSEGALIYQIKAKIKLVLVLTYYSEDTSVFPLDFSLIESFPLTTQTKRC